MGRRDSLLYDFRYDDDFRVGFLYTYVLKIQQKSEVRNGGLHFFC